MGSQIKVVTHDRLAQLRITGRDRPTEIGPVEISVANGSEVFHYQIGQQDTQLLSIPANASIVVTASATFVPEQILGNGDQRSLSVELSVLPDGDTH